METNIRMDEFCRLFTNAAAYDDLKAAQEELERRTFWEADVTDLSVVSLATPIDAELRANDPKKNPLGRDILIDTVDHSGLMLSYAGKEMCLRGCAIPSLLTTAGINGGGISRTNKDQLAIGLTAFLSGAREKSQIMTRAGKVAAILSAQYEYMPASTLLRIVDGLEQQFGDAVFLGGIVSHSLTVAQFAYPLSSERVTKAYQSVLVANGRPSNKKLTPIVQLRASDTSGEAAKLITFLKDGNIMLPLGGFKVIHIPPHEYDANGQRLTCMDKFREEAALLFSKLENDISSELDRMLKTPIAYPGNCFIGLCKYALIPQKWGGIVEEDVRASYPDGSDCRFLDIYEGLAACTAEAVKAGYEPCSQRVLDLEEGISKVLHNHSSWTRYDLPGTVSW